MADTVRQGTVKHWLILCVLFILFVSGHSALNLACIDVKKAYTEKGGNENEVPMQAIAGDHLEVCPQGSTCCTRDMESKLKSLSHKEYSKIIDDAFKYAKSTFVSRTRKFDEFFTELLDKSKSDLHEMFVKTYGLLYQQNSQVFTSLFNDLRSYYKGRDMNLTVALDKFFKELFSKMFELLSVPHRFSDHYLNCVTSQMHNLKPFGDVPMKLSTQVKRSFVAARTFVQGLAIGRNVIMEVLKIPPTEACTKALMKMTYCPHCRGLTQTKPCNNYCLNTMKGCLAYHAELNHLWNDYIEAMKQLAIRLEGPFNIESVVDPIDVKISDAIMTLQENSAKVKEKVHEGCGRPQPHNIKQKRDVTGKSHKSSVPTEPQSDAAPEANPSFTLPKNFKGKFPSSQFNLGKSYIQPSGGKKSSYDQYDHFSMGTYSGPADGKGKGANPTTAAGTSLDRLVKDIKEKVRVAKDFWVQLPYTVCNDDQIAAQPGNDSDCWNGKDRARYVSAVQKDGVINQINNPEVEVNVNEANYIIEQQKIQLRIITNKLNNAFNGEEVTWVTTVQTSLPDMYGSDSVDGSGSGSGDGSGLGSGAGSGLGDGSEGDDEDHYRPTKRPTWKNPHIHSGDGGIKTTGDNDFGPGYKLSTSRPSFTMRPKPTSSSVTVSVSWWCLTVVLFSVKMVYFNVV